jgi:hypothetical protein
VELPPPRRGSAKTKRGARAAYDAGHGHPHGAPSSKRSRATMRALRREGTSAAGHQALSRTLMRLHGSGRLRIDQRRRERRRGRARASGGDS